METLKLWMEEDPEIPQFKRLRYRKIDVPVADVLLKGIHPLCDQSDKVCDKLIEVLNNDDLKPGELAELKYCHEMGKPHTYYSQGNLELTSLLDTLARTVYFVDELSFRELVDIATQRLRSRWCHREALELLQGVYYAFNDMRSFLKEKDRRIKLTGYRDLDRYDLTAVLSVDDFKSEDQLIISHGIPGSVNFRLSGFLAKITDKQGRLRLADGIREFHVAVCRDEKHYDSLAYTCRVDGNRVRFRPEIKRDSWTRKLAADISARFGKDKGRYCFTTDIQGVSAMLEEKGFKIRFPSLDYMEPKKEENTVSASLDESCVSYFSIGRFPGHHSPNETLKKYLKNHSTSMTGRKEQLIKKLAGVAAQVYEVRETELDGYFTGNRFIRVTTSSHGSANSFPVLEDLDLKNMVLAMYIVKHMRGNVILEAGHENDTFDLQSLALALLKGEVALTGWFLKVA